MGWGGPPIILWAIILGRYGIGILLPIILLLPPTLYCGDPGSLYFNGPGPLLF